ncbi:hypothetical protein EG329_006947 [Mollisiaceae sp. DMI_Dod_QoI]|nr:hypothetical protein EG329_006947 [Helotiales sp. DMI_Dod_QoI]
MRSNALLSLSLVLFSFALPACSAYPPFGPYNITSYVSDCVLGECYYSFNITFAPDTSYPPAYQSDTEPAFGPTKCEGSDQQSGFVACEDSNISTNITKLSGDVGNLLVQHIWLVPDGPETRAAQYTITGNTSIELCLYEGPKEFQIYADQESVAA